MIGKEVSHYRILERIGGGGMGVVYKAEDTRLGRPVALKFLHPGLLANESTRKRFLHEARAASVIDHPNVCHVYEVAETDDGRLFLAMSYCEGRSLREVIDSGPVPAREAFSIAFGIAQGLWAAHRRGIVHRDIKPGNVILTDEGYVRIVDFGLALLIGHSRVTTSGVTVGTVAYMSPEQSTGAVVGANTDIWSLGVTLYELMTGQLPFRGEINPAMVYSIVHEPHTPATEVNASIPSECARVIDQCLEKDPAKRYQTIEDLLADMVHVARELGWESSVASATIAPILRARRWKVWRKRVLVGAAAVVVVGAGAWGAYRWTHRTPSPYTTEIRLAMMPLDNLIGGEHEAFVDGLSEHLARVARWVGQRHPSMWTVLYVSVQNAHLPAPTAAAPAFGVNRVLTGDVQRFENGQRLHLNLLDAESGGVLREAVIPFDLAAPIALTDSLLAATARLVGLKAEPMLQDSPWRCRDARAIRAYFEGLSFLEHSKDPGALEHAVALLDSSAALDPRFAAAMCTAGSADYWLYLRNRAPKLLARACEWGREARAACPGFSDADVLLGDVFGSMNLPDSAETCFRAAIVAEPGSVTSCKRLGSLYVAQNRIDEAERVYRDLTLAQPDLWAAHRTLGLFYFNQGRLDEAAAAWQTALTLAPRDGLTLNNLGVIHHRRGEWAQARELFLQSFRIRPDCESCNNVAMTLYFDSKFADATKYFQFALEHCDTTDHLAWGNLARAMYWAPGERDQSIATYKKALRIARTELDQQPDDPDLIAQVMDYSAMVGDSSGTRAMIERVKPFLEDNQRVMYRVGAVYEKLGQREAALDLFGNAVRHGLPLTEIRGDPMLRELVLDPRFQEMVRTEAAAGGAEAASTTH